MIPGDTNVRCRTDWVALNQPAAFMFTVRLAMNIQYLDEWLGICNIQHN